MHLIICLILLLLSHSSFSSTVSIIIDDIGYRDTDKAVLTLPEQVTLSVLPHTPLGADLATQAHRKGHEIMLHLPMHALNGKALGPGGLTNMMSEKNVKQTLVKAIEQVPFAKGANNHMGSLLTQLEQPMVWTMEVLQQQGFYFVDSVTTRYSKAGATANKVGIPFIEREIFLDNNRTLEGLEQQFSKIIELSKHQNKIVVIAHPYPETISYLNNNLYRLDDSGIQLVPTSKLIPDMLITKETIADLTINSEDIMTLE